MGEQSFQHLCLLLDFLVSMSLQIVAGVKCACGSVLGPNVEGSTSTFGGFGAQNLDICIKPCQYQMVWLPIPVVTKFYIA